MVNRVLCLAALMLAMTFPAIANAGKTLAVEADRNQVYEGEVLTVTVRGSMKIDINLSNLFSFDLSQLPSPDIEKAEPDFEILAKNQRYSVQTINGDMIGEITWTYQLAPTRTGTLTIPSLSFKDSTSEPVSIEVLAGAPPDQPAAIRDSFIELSADKAEVFVQEQLVLTVQLFFSGSLIRGELSQPEHPNAIIESLGKQQEYTRMRDGIRYRVVERKYAIFPQTPGTLTLPPIRFEGQARSASGQLRFLRDSEQLFDVPVRPIPASYPSDQPWLPSSNLQLTEQGLPQTQSLEAGSNLSRRITLRAEGLPAEALPPLPQQYPSGVRSYPDRALRNTETTAAGVTATLQQVTALVPVQNGSLRLPEVTIPWWNTTTDTLETAVLPARSFQILGEADLAPPSPETPLQAETEPGQASGQATAAGAKVSPFWFWGTLVFAALWLTTTILWWRARNAVPVPQTPMADRPDRNENDAYRAMVQGIRSSSANSSSLMVHWAQLRFPEHKIQTVRDLLGVASDNGLATAFEQYQRAHFGGLAGSSPGRYQADLEQGLARLRNRSGKKNTRGLPPLYPETLNGA
ncbi:protein BatD [Marinobacter fuscus]|uniref:Protein BatD n=1 Tax=Marinobacter fuscus TaxID=2109942 RepID=A0A2T1K7S0_9GAMM|nr:BatD family protein [Marinobacter fuscus]PSF06147.1 protein BatD [Marinobacter fuscus]